MLSNAFRILQNTNVQAVVTMRHPLWLLLCNQTRLKSGWLPIGYWLMRHRLRKEQEWKRERARKADRPLAKVEQEARSHWHGRTDRFTRL